MFDAQGLSTHPVDVGIRSEGAILGELSKRGYDVYAPFSYNSRFDFLIDAGDRFIRAQCKTGRRRGGAIIFNKVSTRSNMTLVERRPYGPNDVDIFLVYYAANDTVYAIAIDEVSRGLSSLRLEPTGNSRSRGIHWATDYVLGVGVRALMALPPAPGRGLRLASVPE